MTLVYSERITTDCKCILISLLCPTLSLKPQTFSRKCWKDTTSAFFVCIITARNLAFFLMSWTINISLLWSLHQSLIITQTWYSRTIFQIKLTELLFLMAFMKFEKIFFASLTASFVKDVQWFGVILENEFP